MISSDRFVVAFWSCLCVLVAGGLCWAGQVPVSEYSPHSLEGGDLSETWDYRITFDNGYLISCSFGITNAGPADGAGFVLTYIYPPDGDMRIIRNSRGQGDWKFETDSGGPSFYIAKNELHINLPKHRIHVDNQDGTLDLDLENVIGPVQPDRVMLTDKDWFQLTLFGPRFRSNGSLTFPGEEPISLTGGRGVAIHTRSNMADNKVAATSFRFDSFDSELEISLFEYITAPKYDSRRIRILFLNDDGAEAVHTEGIQRTFFGFSPDPKKKSYLIPSRFILKYDNGETKLKGRGDLELHIDGRLPMLTLLNSKTTRKLLSMVSSPVLYQFSTAYEIQVNHEGSDRQFEGTGVSSILVNKKPPADF